jgi:hypothetical protein
MRTRHRIPSVFNLSMVDVLCCALGCVILLWLLNLRDAKQKAAQAGQSDEQVQRLRRDLDAARAQLQDASARYAALQSQFDAAEAEARATAASLKKAQAERDAETARVGRLEKDLAALKAGKASDDEALARRAKEMAALQGQLRDRNADAAAAARRADDLAAKLKEAEARVKDYRDKLAAEEAVAKGLEKEIAKRMQGLEDAEKGLSARDRDLERTRKDLDAARRAVAALEDEKKGLVTDAERVRAAADNRFAGIQLTGRRVVFLVDMSGSMEYVDEKTLAPDKWTGVRDTLAKIMRSLPSLEKYQVILFSDKVTYPLGADEGWLNYDGQSAERAVATLKRIQPKGGTNMYAAFEAAFRFRPQGLDTVYLLSDGLPNMGEGLTDAQSKSLKETEQAEILGKHVRRKLQSDWNHEVQGKGRVRVNAVGFFYESPDVGAFLWALTRENEGGFVGMSKP